MYFDKMDPTTSEDARVFTHEGPQANQNTWFCIYMDPKIHIFKLKTHALARLQKAK